MLRLAELALFLAPSSSSRSGACWRPMAVRRYVWSSVAACVLGLLAGILIWLSQDDALPPGANYVPAQLQDGQMVSGHAVPR